MDAADFSALAAARHSVRSFLPDPIPQDVLVKILVDATSAPSWSNTRAFKLALAAGDRAERLRAAYGVAFDRTLTGDGAGVDGDFDVQARYPDAQRAHQIAIGKALYKHLGIERQDQEARSAHTRRNAEAFGAPVIGLVFVQEGMLPFSAMDAGLMLQTLFLSAKANGVDSCPIGNLAVWRSPADQEFEVPQDYKLITGFALGYASDERINDFWAERRPIEMLTPK